MADRGGRATRDALAILDVGTTSTRAFVMGLDGTVLGTARESNRLDTPAPDRAEQDPLALLRAAETLVARAVDEGRAAGAEIHGLVVSTQMHSLLVADADGAPVRPLITWADTRAEAAVAAVRADPGWRELYARTGCPPHASYPLYKLMALRAAGEAPRPTDRVADLKSWLIRTWTGRWVVDRSLASGSGLLDLAAMDWDPEALALAGTTRERLPEIVDTTAALPLTTTRLGLPVGTPIVVGAGDGVLSSLGSGGGAGTAVVMVGTSGAVRVGARAPIPDRDGRLFSYYLAEGRWVVGGALSNGGIVLDWLARLLGIETADVLSAAETVPAGAGGLVLLPLLAGERAPGYDGLARATWFGLGLEHDRGHLGRAALEGIAYAVRSVLEVAEEATGSATEIRATGGLARSPLWLRVLAGVLDRPLDVPADVEGSTVGALILGGVALGLLPDLDHGSELVKVALRVEPMAADREAGDLGYALYRRLDGRLRPEFPALAALRAASAGPGAMMER